MDYLTSIRQVCLVCLNLRSKLDTCEALKAALNTGHGADHVTAKIYTHFEETGMSLTGPMLLICSPPFDTGATGATGATSPTGETGMTGVLVVDWGWLPLKKLEPQ